MVDEQPRYIYGQKYQLALVHREEINHCNLMGNHLGMLRYHFHVDMYLLLMTKHSFLFFMLLIMVYLRMNHILHPYLILLYQEVFWKFDDMSLLYFMHTILVGMCEKERYHKCLINILNIYFITIVLCDADVFFQYRDTLKCKNHAMKIAKTPKLDEPWFQDVLQLSSVKDSYRT